MKRVGGVRTSCGTGILVTVDATRRRGACEDVDVVEGIDTGDPNLGHCRFEPTHETRRVVNTLKTRQDEEHTIVSLPPTC